MELNYAEEGILGKLVQSVKENNAKSKELNRWYSMESEYEAATDAVLKKYLSRTVSHVRKIVANFSKSFGITVGTDEKYCAQQVYFQGIINYKLDPKIVKDDVDVMVSPEFEACIKTVKAAINTMLKVQKFPLPYQLSYGEDSDCWRGSFGIEIGKEGMEKAYDLQHSGDSALEGLFGPKKPLPRSVQIAKDLRPKVDPITKMIPKSWAARLDKINLNSVIWHCFGINASNIDSPEVQEVLDKIRKYISRADLWNEVELVPPRAQYAMLYVRKSKNKDEVTEASNLGDICANMEIANEKTNIYGPKFIKQLWKAGASQAANSFYVISRPQMGKLGKSLAGAMSSDIRPKVTKVGIGHIEISVDCDKQRAHEEIEKVKQSSDYNTNVIDSMSVKITSEETFIIVKIKKK